MSNQELEVVVGADEHGDGDREQEECEKVKPAERTG